MKKVAPIVVTIIMSIYISFYIVFVFVTKEQSFMGEVFLGVIGVAAVAMLIALIKTLIARLKEIDKEENNDLSKY